MSVCRSFSSASVRFIDTEGDDIDAVQSVCVSRASDARLPIGPFVLCRPSSTYQRIQPLQVASLHDLGQVNHDYKPSAQFADSGDVIHLGIAKYVRRSF